MSNIGITEIILLVLLPLALMMGLSTFLVFFMAMRGKSAKSKKRRCSFCGGEEKEDARLISGRAAFICESCVVRCHQMIVSRSGEQSE